MTVDPTTGQEWTPEFEGQRPPFQPGNTLAVTHGAYSPALIEPAADAMIQAIQDSAAWSYLAAPEFAIALRSWARAAARVERLEEWVEGMTMDQAAYSDRGQTSPLELLRKWTTTLDGKAARLGLDPLSQARLGKDIAGRKQADAATLLTQARAAAEGR